ncbi:MAG: putative TonB-dependent receptor [Acinetobacter bereziniae]|uniref:Putative TonB-dependent receptor n=1 Tax=Acinetobacter bereziniae TaxID=106648 RepID=A0A833PDX2_ACIBZ|nr:MAG: putative TonB-dependent receptor [Acinetobacter bereziniae]
MRCHSLAIAISFPIFPAYAVDNKELNVLPIIRVDAEKDIFKQDLVVVKNKNADNKTLGDALKQVSGVQSSAFGPNAGAPVIRSLGGNRVQILENGQSLYGMNAISGNIDIPFDPLFSQSITVNKSSDTVRYGGNAIGGSVDIDTGIIDQVLPEKKLNWNLSLKRAGMILMQRALN